VGIGVVRSERRGTCSDAPGTTDHQTAGNRKQMSAMTANQFAAANSIAGMLFRAARSRVRSRSVL